MSDQLAQSYAACRTLARRSASNFYYSFLFLPRPKRKAMCALYAYLRRTDDLGDSSQPLAERRAALLCWRRSLDRAISGQFDDPLLPALVDSVSRFQIPLEYLYAVIDGVEMDLDHVPYESFDDLEQYCYRVASVVGLACIHIWGFTDSAALEPARQCGLALQLTNILRDLKEDAAAGRMYLPQDDLRRFNYGMADLNRGVCNGPFRDLMHFQVERAERLYDAGVELDRWLDPHGRRVFRTIIGTYRGLLEQIKRLDGDVLSGRVSLSGWHKLRIATGSLLSNRSWATSAAAIGPR